MTKNENHINCDEELVDLEEGLPEHGFTQEELDDMEAKKRKAQKLRERKREKKKMELIEQWLEDWWDVNISDDAHLVRMDQFIHGLVE